MSEKRKSVIEPCNCQHCIAERQAAQWLQQQAQQLAKLGRDWDSGRKA